MGFVIWPLKGLEEPSLTRYLLSLCLHAPGRLGFRGRRTVVFGTLYIQVWPIGAPGIWDIQAEMLDIDAQMLDN